MFLRRGPSSFSHVRPGGWPLGCKLMSRLTGCKTFLDARREMRPESCLELEQQRSAVSRPFPVCR